MASQIFAVNSRGGLLATSKLTKMLRHSAQTKSVLRQFVTVKEKWGARKGTTVLLDKQMNLSSSVSRKLSETATVPTEGVTYNQASCTIAEYGISIDYTRFLDMVAEYDVPAALDRALTNDMVKELDKQVGAIATGTELVAVCQATNTTTFYTNGTATNTASVNISVPNLKDIVDYAKRLNVPPYDERGNYVLIGSVNSVRGLKDSVESVGQYAAMTAEEFATGRFLKPLNGEVGRIYGCRIVEETNFLSNVKGASSNKGEALLLGGDSLYEAVAEAEEIREKMPQDYGRDRGIGWFFTGGWTRPWAYATDSEQRIIWVTSG